MKVVLFTGSHPRHLYVAEGLRQSGFLRGIVMETREDFILSPPPGLIEMDRENFIRHFRDRHNAEREYFGERYDALFDESAILKVDLDGLNSERVRQWVAAMNPDVVLTYGVHKISNELLEVFPPMAWNIHGGLSPWFRGNTTLFWPFYFMKPNWTGMTIHQLTSKLDGGAIIHHSVPKLRRGDGLHDVACRAVKQVVEDVIVILKNVSSGIEILSSIQKSSGKLFMYEDWTPQHLRVVYNLFNNDIVDKYLDGELGHSEPPLIKAF